MRAPNAGRMSLVSEATKQRRATLRPLKWTRNLGWKWPEISGAGSPRTASWRSDDPGDDFLFGQPAAAMIGETGVVVAEDPGPVEATGHARERSRARRGAGRSRSGRGSCRRGNRFCVAPRAFDQPRQRGERRVRIIGRKEMAEAGEPARFFEMEVGNEQGISTARRARRRGWRGNHVRRTKREPWPLTS